MATPVDQRAVRRAAGHRMAGAGRRAWAREPVGARARVGKCIKVSEQRCWAAHGWAPRQSWYGGRGSDRAGLARVLLFPGRRGGGYRSGGGMRQFGGNRSVD
eukprot:gene12931-biopygen2760